MNYNYSNLITGTRSGFGRYIHENLAGFGLTRDTTSDEIKKLKEQGVNIIVHCAFNSSSNVDSDSLYKYVKDNVLLTSYLTTIPHKKFIFLSTLEVYPQDQTIHTEKENIVLNSIKGIYPITKLMSESIVRESCKNHLILRCSHLLGRYSRKNNLIRAIEEKNPVLSLSSASVINCVAYSDVLDFIKFAIKNDKTGIYNLVSKENITLPEIAGLFGKTVKCGKYDYNCGDVSNHKVVSIFPAFEKTSKEVIQQYANERTSL